MKLDINSSISLNVFQANTAFYDVFQNVFRTSSAHLPGKQVVSGHIVALLLGKLQVFVYGARVALLMMSANGEI